MTATSNSSKLAQLRAKTDRDLAAIIENALDLGLLLAADIEPASPLHRKALDFYATSVMLLEKLEDVGEQQRLEAKLSQLRDALDRRVQVVGAAG